ncbi:MAG TPA: N-acetyltransferase [Anaerolineaceae bacterium]|nr:N-acetyltransferase [Anaerolineaceae bacterium]
MNRGIASVTRPSPRILELARWIYPQAAELIAMACKSGTMKTCLYQNHPECEGVFCLIEQEHFIVGFLAFSKDMPDEDWREILKNQVENHLPDPPSSELCFTLYGRNPRAMQYVQSLGFRLDMHGLLMHRSGIEPPDMHDSGLEETGLVVERINEFCELLDQSYADQNQAKGWKVDWHTSHITATKEKLSAYEKNDSLRSYWKDEILVGVCLTSGPYLSDLAVHPRFQNQGYGSAILARCIRRLTVEKGMPEVRLRVPLENEKAIQLYQHFGFVEAGCFADHTYAPRKQAH